jgi:lactate racemase
VAVHVRLAYGERSLEVSVPDDRTSIIEPVERVGVANEPDAIARSLERPIESPSLGDLVARHANPSVCIVFSDITRPVPNRRLLPVLLSELSGVDADRITLLNATGLHRPNTSEELAGMLGEDIVRKYRTVNHDANDAGALATLGRTSSGNLIEINRHYAEADVRILTGFIEPHFFAGFSGGPKSMLPGIAGARSIMANHRASYIAHPNATWAITRGNPIHEEALEACALLPPSLIVNVTMNASRAITGVFSGDVAAAHQAGCAFVGETALRPVSEPFDVVVTTNGGYPLDLNVYQTVKGMSAAARIVKPGGTIIMVAECREGLGHGEFAHLLREGASPTDLLTRINSPGFSVPDQWQVQIQAQILRQARVLFYSDRMNPEDIRSTHLEPVDSVSEAIRGALSEHGPTARLAVLPQGPLTIPYIANPVSAGRS